MENNKKYLQSLPWAVIPALLSTVFFIAVLKWMPLNDTSTSWYKNPYFISVSITNILYWIAFASVTKKIKESVIALSVSLLTVFGSFLFFSWNQISTGSFLYWLFINPLPVVIFIGLITGWSSKIPVAWFFLILANTVGLLGDYAIVGLTRLINQFFHFHSDNLWPVLQLIVRPAVFLFYIIIVCEIINFLTGKEYNRKTTLLNLGNQYSKGASVLLFWVLKTMLLVLIVSMPFYLNNIRELTVEHRYGFTPGEGMIKALHLSSAFSLFSFIPVVIFFGWYFRKFLLESFISFSLSSKFLFWICFLPLVGFIAYGIAIAGKKSTGYYSQKMAALTGFASSASTAVSVSFFILLALRILSRFQADLSGVLITAVLSGLLFTWLISHRSGYYFSWWLTVLCMLALAVVCVVNRSVSEEFFLYLGLLSFNLIHLMVLLPVYHIEAFSYIPVEAPASENAEGSLFPDMYD